MFFNKSKIFLFHFPFYTSHVTLPQVSLKSTHRSTPTMWRFFIGFVLIQGILFTAELARPIQTYFVQPWTQGVAYVSAWLIQLIDSQVIAHGVIIQSTVNHFSVAIRPGCNGVEAMIILAAAIFAFPYISWKHKLWGFVWGVITVQFLNLLRIISLFYLGQWYPTAFEWAHLYVWNVLIMLDVLVVFLIWLRVSPTTQMPIVQKEVESK